MLVKRIALVFHVLLIRETIEDFITTQTGPKPIWDETITDQLKKELFVNYDKYVRPAHDFNSTEVKIGLIVHHVSVDEARSSMTVHGYIQLVWTDFKLQWNPQRYKGLDVLRLADHEIWQPDIFFFNSALGSEPISRFGNQLVMVYSKGSALWFPYVKLTALCEFHLENWPYDHQTCGLKFGSWTHNENQLKMSLYSNNSHAELELLIPNGPWSITKTTAEIIHSPNKNHLGPRYYAQFNISIARAPNAYKSAIVTPLHVLVILTLLQFWLPPNAKEKLLLSGMVAIMTIMFLLFFTHFISVGSYSPTSLVSSYTNCLLMVVFAILFNIATYTLSTIEHTHSPPRRLTKHLRGLLGDVLLVGQHTGETFVVDGQFSHQVSSAAGGVVLQKGAKHRMQGDWIRLAGAVDRILFLVYCVVFMLLLVETSEA